MIFIKKKNSSSKREIRLSNVMNPRCSNLTIQKIKKESRGMKTTPERGETGIIVLIR